MIKAEFVVEAIENGFLVIERASGRVRHAAHEWSIGREVEMFVHQLSAAPEASSAPMQQVSEEGH